MDCGKIIRPAQVAYQHQTIYATVLLSDSFAANYASIPVSSSEAGQHAINYTVTNPAAAIDRHRQRKSPDAPRKAWTRNAREGYTAGKRRLNLVVRVAAVAMGELVNHVHIPRMKIS